MKSKPLKSKPLKNKPPIILGIDPGYDRVGWAVGRGTGPQPIILCFGCIQTPQKISLSQRYQLIDHQLSEVISIHQPQELAIETLYYSKNKKTALQVSEARGVILSCATRHHLHIFEYAPNQIKLAVTGYGHADKKAVEKMVRLQLTISEEKIIDDVIDALAIVLTHAVTSG